MLHSTNTIDQFRQNISCVLLYLGQPEKKRCGCLDTRTPATSRASEECIN